MTVTEVGCMGVKPGMQVTDPSAPEGTVLPGVWKTVLSKHGGPKRVFWGVEDEDHSKVWAFFDWESVQQHEDFAKTYGAEAVKAIPQVCTHGEFTKHISFSPSTDALGSAITRFIVAYFAPDTSTEDKDAILQEVRRPLLRINNGPHDTTATASGWGVENDFPVRGADGKLGSVLMILIGDEESGPHDALETKLVGIVQGMNGLLGLHQFRMHGLQHERE